MKRSGILIIAGIGILLAAVSYYNYNFNSLHHQKENRAKAASRMSLFSWEGEYLEPDRENDVMYIMDKLGCDVIYQEIPSDVQEDMLLDYLSRRAQAGQEVYYLTGDARWGLAGGDTNLLAAVEKVKDWNDRAGKGRGFTGIVFDVEPYLLEEWDDDREAVMEQYVGNMTRAYEAAGAEDLSVIVCIPNFYDRIHLEQQLESLVQNACDAIAVMNYDKSDEAGQIFVEVLLAEKYEKGILNIIELQKPGFHELTEENTYYHDGIEAAGESFIRLKERFPYDKLGFSWHYLKPALEIAEEGERG